MCFTANEGTIKKVEDDVRVVIEEDAALVVEGTWYLSLSANVTKRSMIYNEQEGWEAHASIGQSGAASVRITCGLVVVLSK